MSLMRHGLYPSGVCVRLRETIAVLFPERSAARRHEVDRQQALEKKRGHAAVDAGAVVMQACPSAGHALSGASTWHMVKQPMPL